MNDHIFTDREAAAYLKMKSKTSWKTIQKYAREGIIKGVKVGCEWRFHKQRLDDYLMVKS